MDFIEAKWAQWMAFYNECMENADPRVADWFLMQGFTPTLVLSVLYLIIVYCLKIIMKNEKAVEIRGVLIVYNSCMVALNFHIAYELFTCTWRRNYSYSCTPVDYSDQPDEIRIAKAIWWFYFSKCLEFFDTIFFVLRKKMDQVTFLHVYHHASMFPIWWIGAKWVPGGQAFFGAMINSSVHVIMYTYYAVSALGPSFQKFLWWKRYLTKIQLIQFCAGITHAAQSLYVNCDFPAWMQWALIVYAFTILLLFLNFYFHAYILNRRTGGYKASVNGKHHSDTAAHNSKSTNTAVITRSTTRQRVVLEKDTF